MTDVPAAEAAVAQAEREALATRRAELSASLSDEEKRYATAMGLTTEEYALYRDVRTADDAREAAQTIADLDDAA